MRNYLALLLAAGLVLTGCSKESTTSVKQPVKPDIETQQVVEQAWLRDILPSEALAYARLPNLWFSFSSLENGFKYALGNESHVQQLKNIQSGLYANFVDALDPRAKIAVAMLTRHLASPLELAVLPGESQPMPPKVVVASTFNFDSVDAFKAAFDPLVKLAGPNIVQTKPTDSDGVGELMVQGANVHYRFDSASKQFEMVVGMGPATGLGQVVPSMTANSQHPMYGIEEQTDTSKSGLFVWVSPKAILPLAGPMIPPREMAQLTATGLDKVESVSLGYGVANGKTRLQLMVEMPDVGVRQLLPIVNNRFNFESVGQPSMLASFSIPTPEQMARMEAGFESMGGLPLDYTMFKQQWAEEMGYSIEELLGMVGPELVYFKDDLGEFLALRVGNRETLNKLLKSSENTEEFDYNVRKSGSAEIHHVVTPMIESSVLDSLPVRGPEAMFFSVVSEIDSHIFWLDEGDFLIFSDIPQPLVERAASKNKVSVEQWLADSQRQDLSGALLGVSGTVDRLSRKTYVGYVQSMQMLADVVGAEFDIFALPAASELGFAERGSLTMNLDLQDKYLALEFGFEQSMADLLYAGGSYQTAAVAGILAAIALPAYQDYVRRSKAAAASLSM